MRVVITKSACGIKFVNRDSSRLAEKKFFDGAVVRGQDPGAARRHNVGRLMRLAVCPALIKRILNIANLRACHRHQEGPVERRFSPQRERKETQAAFHSVKMAGVPFFTIPASSMASQLVRADGIQATVYARMVDADRVRREFRSAVSIDRSTPFRRDSWVPERFSPWLAYRRRPKINSDRN